MGEILTFHEMPPSISFVGGVPSGTARGQRFTKPFNLTLVVVLVSSDLYLQSQVERLRISEKGVLSP